MIKKSFVSICILVLIMVSGCIESNTQKNSFAPKDLNLSNFPGIFGEKVYVVVADNASPDELDAAKRIVAYVKEKTGYEPDIKKQSSIDKKEKSDLNLVLIGKTDPTAVYRTSDPYDMNSNTIIGDLYRDYDTKNIRKLEIKGLNSYWQGTNKGYLVFFNNPWSKNNRWILIISGFDNKGLNSATSTLLNSSLIKTADDKGLAVKLEYKGNNIEIIPTIELAKSIAKDIARGSQNCQSYPEHVFPQPEILSETDSLWLIKDGCNKEIFVDINSGEVTKK